jgi:sec-independent protein translocase protein TatA
MPGSIGWQGLIVILLVLLVVFGPKRLPELGRSLGRGMREFKDSVTGDSRGDKDDHEPLALEHEIGRSPEPDATVPGETRHRDTVT